MNTNTFENYLMDVHAKDYHGIDDDMIDSFNAWVERLEGDEILQYAEDFATELNRKYQLALKVGKEAVEELQKIGRMATI